MKLQNFAENQWIVGSDEGKPLASAVDGRPVAAGRHERRQVPPLVDHRRLDPQGGRRLRRWTRRGAMAFARGWARSGALGGCPVRSIGPAGLGQHHREDDECAAGDLHR